MGIRLAEEEKLGSLGRLSSAIAHEINDPFGGLFNALDVLKRHGDKERVRQTSISLLAAGAGVAERRTGQAVRQGATP